MGPERFCRQPDAPVVHFNFGRAKAEFRERNTVSMMEVV